MAKEEVMADAGDSGGKKNLGKQAPAADNVVELTEEELELKTNLELQVEKLGDADASVQAAALEVIAKEIRTATSSMTSVPKPLKFLRPHFESLVDLHSLEKLTGENQPRFADILSVLAMTSAKEGSRQCLYFRLKGSSEPIGAWGHEYVRHLTGEIASEMKERTEREGESAKNEDLLELVSQIIPYHMTHNAEPEAVDLLVEVERLDMLEAHTDEKNYSRTCLYLVSCCHYLPEPDNMTVLRTAYNIYRKMEKYGDAMRVALKMNSKPDVEATFNACTDRLERQQLCHLLARQGFVLNLEDGPVAIEDEDEREKLLEIMSNSKLSEYYLMLARDLDVMEPKTPQEVYKNHLVDGQVPPSIDSAKQNLASTFVNAFVNAGFGQDKLLTAVPDSASGESVSWIYKNKDHGKMSAAASLGMVTLWDVEGGLTQIDKYMYVSDQHVVAGALLAVGIVNSCVHNENDPAFALLFESVSKESTPVRVGAIMGLGLAYAGTCKEEVQELLVPVVMDSEVPMEVVGFAALSLGLVFSGTQQEDCVQAILQTLMTRGEHELEEPYSKLLCLALGLLFLGKQEAVEATLEVAKTLNERISQFCQVTLTSLAYAGTGDVLKVQELLALCGEHIEVEDNTAWKAIHQGPAVMGIALIAMGEELGTAMVMRMLEHLLQYGEAAVRRAVPLAVALLSTSNPDMSAMDMLSRLSHDTDSEVSHNAILALGIMGAGTNNARMAGMLRNLSSYYAKEPSHLFMVRIAQGLVHMGKGLLTLSPFHTDRQLLSGVALSGILSVLYCALDTKSTIAGKHHYVLYYLACSMKPRMLLTLDEEGNQVCTAVRVGQAVDVVAQAGRPKTITGFQTHTTPVLLGTMERAELATDKYIPVSPVLEGLVVLKPNPDYVETADK
uniref:26S proteasome non-ATPase regulatory subunit 2 homolog n=1 Tax=Tetraselmis sp. GSL018 TaxID=582737 RepID=A0A061RYU3_9CHLO